MRAGRRAYAGLLIIGAATGLAVVPAGHAQLPSCPPGATNLLYCQTTGNQTAAALVKGIAPSANVCTTRNSRVRLNLTIAAAGGVARVTVLLDGRVVHRQTAPHLKLALGTRGLGNGVHTITLRIVARDGTRTTRRYHFRICRLPRIPTFTG